MDMITDSATTSSFSPPPPASSPVRLLRRSRDDKMLAGVCGGIAHYTGVDPVLVRVLAVSLAIFTAGTAILAYLVACVLMPREAPWFASDPAPPAAGASPTAALRDSRPPTPSE